jgi:uncharacterized membrane protein
MKKFTILFFAISLIVVSCTFENVKPLPVGCTSTIFYATDIVPLMNNYCVSCHYAGGSGPGDYTLYSDVKAAVDNDKIKNRVFTLKDMPQAGSPQCTADELGKLKCWLDQGAPNN